MENQNLVGLIIISTGKYDIFLQPLLNSADKWFFPGRPIDIYHLSDKEVVLDVPSRMTYKRFFVPHLKFPYPTLFRYKWIHKYREELTSDNLFYIDADMLFENPVGPEILPDSSGLVAVRHPGFFRGGWGDNGTHPMSTAYLNPALRKEYYAGGFQGGERMAFLKAVQTLSENIDIDLDTAENLSYQLNNGILAKWNDESHWNHYLKYHPFKALTPEYCMVEQIPLREKWGINQLTPRIIALEKNHEEIRD